MSNDFLTDVEYTFTFRNAVFEQLESQTRKRLYAKRPDLWAKDVLGATMWSSQVEVALSIVNHKNTMVAAGHGIGKALTNSELHPTPTGWVKTSDIRPGTELYDEMGNVTRVTALSQWWDQDIYRLTFDDGETLDAGENHEFDAIDLTRRSRADGTKNGVTDWREYWHTAFRVTAKEMSDNIRTTANQLRWKIPIAAPLVMPEADLPIDPYLLGFWLGDGTSESGSIAFGETKTGLIDWLSENGHEFRRRSASGCELVTPVGLTKALRKAGFKGNKHIPIEYLRASEAQRRELLAGIMDSDGFLLKPGVGAEVGIDLTRKELADGVAELVRSLGGTIRCNEGVAAYTKNGTRTVTGTRYRMNWRPLENPFKIRGKSWVNPSRQRSRFTARTIVSVEKIGRDRVRCIEVDSPSHLYLAGKGMIPTHNSYLTAVLACWWIDIHPIGEARVLTTAPTTAQVRGIVWREIQLMHNLSKKRYALYLEAKKAGHSTAGLPDHPLPGYVTSSATWRSDDGLELGMGRTPPRGREGDAFQGIHGGVFAIADEAVGVSKDMIDTLANNTTADEDRRLLIANPTNPASEMGQIWNDPVRSMAWNRITISVLDSPHFTNEGATLPPEVMKHMTNQQYVEDKKMEYGEDSANFKARVKGEWALDTGFVLFPDEVLQIGLETLVIPEPTDIPRVGFDVARSEHGDWSYLYTAQEGFVYEKNEWRKVGDSYDWVDLPKPRKTDRRGIRLRYLDRWRGLPFFPIRNQSGDRVTDVAANERVHAHMVELAATELRIDADGMGAIMYDAMVDVANGEYHLIRMKNNDPSPDRNAWYNRRAYQHSELAQRLRRGEVDLQPDKPEHPLVQQLGGIEYKFASGYAESMLLLSKKEMSEKGRKSPDAADSAVYAFADVDLDSLLGLQPGDKFELDLDLYASSSIYSSNSFLG